MLNRRQFNRAGAAVAAVALAISVAAPLQASPAAQDASPVSGNIIVFAAASLRDAFNEAGKKFEAANPGTKVTFQYAGSQQLAEQIGFGAPADVFASANNRLMDAVVKTGRVNAPDPRTFVRNRLVVVYPKSNPARLRTLKDLTKPGLKLVLANKTVPAGSYSLDFLAKASAKPEFGATFSQTVLANVVSYEEDVRAVFNKVQLGEADAGIVYSSDVLTNKRGDVRTIDIPDALNTLAAYPIAPLNDSPNPALARRFVQYVLSPAGQRTLQKYGFIPAGRTK